LETLGCFTPNASARTVWSIPRIRLISRIFSLNASRMEKQTAEEIAAYEKRVAEVARAIRYLAQKCSESNFRVDLRRSEDARLWARNIVENAL